MDTTFVSVTPARDPLIGRLIQERYRVEKRIGKGGMGIVYLAEHVLLRRKVALKTLSERAFASDEMVKRFHREAVAAAAVGNEHIVGVTDMGWLDDGSAFIVLEYLEGMELSQAVDLAGPFPLARAVHVVSQLCDALTAVHAAGIVHRDLKPENLFLIERQGVPDFVKVLDFGVCKVLDERRPGEPALTGTGATLGTPQFMAPEQVEGSAVADHRSDVYAAGAILYFTLTGRDPFRAVTLPQLFVRICCDPAPSLREHRPELPVELDAVIVRAMAKLPDDRYQTSAELRAALQPWAALEQMATISRPSSSPAPSLGPISHPLSDSALSLGSAAALRRSLRTGAQLKYVASAVVLCLVLALCFVLASGPRAAHPAATPAPAHPSEPARAHLTTAAEHDATPEPRVPSQAAANGGSAGPVAPAAAAPPQSAPPSAHAGGAARSAHARGDAPVAPMTPNAQDPNAQPSTTGTGSAAPADPPTQAQPATTPSGTAYRLSERRLKDVFP